MVIVALALGALLFWTHGRLAERKQRLRSSEPSQHPIRFSLRRMLVVLTVIAIVLGVASGGVRWLNSIVMDVERDAARQRVLDRGDEAAYDRQLLGDEVDALKADYRRRSQE
jgi:hypothetical protein